MTAVSEVDLSAEWVRADPAGAFDSLRDRSWLIRTVRGLEVLSYEIATRMCVDRNLDSIGAAYYENLGASEPIMWWATEGSLPMIEGVRHDRIRRVLQQGFTRRRIEALRPAVHQLARDLIDGIPRGEPFDLVERFTERFPIEVLCALMGVPREDVPLFRGWLVDMGLLARVPLTPHMPRIDAAIDGLREYLRALAAMRRRDPGSDFVSALVEAQRTGESISESELEGALLNLLFAGHDTTRYQFAWVVQLLVEEGRWEQVGADRALVPVAVNETMRLQPALHILLRKALTAVTYDDLVIAEGSLLAINVFAANRDPAAFPNPHRFDLGRPNAGRHLGFGHGGHLCLGHALARLEMATALDVLLDRFATLALASEPVHEPGFSSMSGAEELVLVGG